jgi:formylglycine-generating enzyme required for sulfatase activity
VVAGYEDFKTATPKPPHACAALPSSKTTERQTLVLVEVPNESCFWIDQTEVTVGQYKAWLEGDPGFSDWDTYYCLWKPAGASDPVHNSADLCRQQIPQTEVDPFGVDKPIRCVDWCDAEAFCRRAGAHLCHDSNTGGSLEPWGYPAEWRLACTNSYETAYPWGSEEERTPDGTCNVLSDHGCGYGAPTTISCGPTIKGLYRDCTSKNGAQDLIGNVAEWIFLCARSLSDGTAAASSPDGECKVFGGSYAQSLTHATCSALNLSEPKRTRAPDLGFRCCTDLGAEERDLVRANPAAGSTGS